MRLLIATSLALALGLSACQTESGDSLSTDLVTNSETAAGNAQNVDLPIMSFEKEVLEFGTITQGESVHLTYEFTNTGNADLVITAARGSCGCTVPDYPKRPIAPGEKGKIKVVFNSAGKVDKQRKEVYITANTEPSQNTVVLTGEVIAPTPE